MKNIYFLIISVLLVSSSLSGQRNLVDTLSIIVNDEVSVEFISNNIHLHKRTLHWQDLVTDFQKELKKVEKEIPNYGTYEIRFVKNEKITAEERISEENKLSYKIKRGSISPKKYNSIATLSKSRGNLKINIYFQDIPQLINEDFVGIVAEAIDKIENKPIFTKSIVKSNDNYRYFYDCQLLEKETKEKQSYKPHPLIFLDGSVERNYGSKYLSSSTFIGLNFGVGVSLGDKNKHSFFAIGSYVHEFVETFSTRDLYFGGMYKPNRWSSVSLLKQVPRKSDQQFSERTRVCISLYPIKNVRIIYTRYIHSIIHSNGIGIGVGI